MLEYTFKEEKMDIKEIEEWASNIEDGRTLKYIDYLISQIKELEKALNVKQICHVCWNNLEQDGSCITCRLEKKIRELKEEGKHKSEVFMRIISKWEEAEKQIKELEEGKMELLRKLFYPLEVKIVKGNPYGLPIGKIFRGKRKEGDGSPFPIEIHGDRIYQMAENEVEIILEKHSTRYLE